MQFKTREERVDFEGYVFISQKSGSVWGVAGVGSISGGGRLLMRKSDAGRSLKRAER